MCHSWHIRQAVDRLKPDPLVPTGYNLRLTVRRMCALTKPVWLLFATAAGCVVLRAILVSRVIASAASQGGLAAVYFSTSSMFREFDAIVLVSCIAAFAFWAVAAWTLGGHWLLRIFRCAGTLIASFGILLLLSRGLYAVPLLR